MADDIDALIDEYGEDTVRKAFWLQQKIYEEGLRGIDFTGAAEEAMEETAETTVKENIEKRFVRSI